jgi:beta-lactamase class A
MEYGHLRERQRRLHLPLLEIFSTLLVFGAIVLGMIELVQYSNARAKDQLPTRLTIAEVPVGGLSENDARALLEEVYVQQPIRLLYGSSLIELPPGQIGFRLNTDAMLASARDQSVGSDDDFWPGFWNYLGQQSVKEVTVPLDWSYDESELRLYLQDIAVRYDAVAGQAGFNTMTLTFERGAPGRTLDLEQSMPLIMAALQEPESANRRVILPLVDTGASNVSLDTLEQAIINYMDMPEHDYWNNPQHVASVYVLDLQSGEEVSILGDVVYSAVSTIKIPIMINVFREKLTVPQDYQYLLTESIMCSNNSASNRLIEYAGTGVAYSEDQWMARGLDQLSCTAQTLGASHTFMNAWIWLGQGSPVSPVFSVCLPETPGNPDINTTPDPNSQTTAEDMGLMLSEIYDCTQHGSGLMAIYPHDITQTECRWMENLLSGNRIDRLIELGVPLGTRVEHKNGWGQRGDATWIGDGTSGDAAIVFSPGGTYVLAVYTWSIGDDGIEGPIIQDWELIEEISRLVYNYFNPSAPLFERRTPINPYTAIDCVTVSSTTDVNLDDINANRLDANGDPLPTACYGGAGDCRTWTDWTH